MSFSVLKSAYLGFFKNLFKKLVIFGLVFLLLFTFRIIYGYSIKIPAYTNTSPSISGMFSSRNYASKKYKKKLSQGLQGSINAVDQKYEKIAKIDARSTKFQTDEDRIRKKIKARQALIQFEQKSGNKGKRRLILAIGVPPNNFDQLYQEMVQLGFVVSKQITKKDKTNEYKELNAKKESLEKTRTSLIGLKKRNGDVQEFVRLENRILEIEKELQNLGVTLGSFDEENEFCTIEYSLIESRKRVISTLHRVKVALEWTVKFYLRLMVSLCFFFGFIAIISLLTDFVVRLIKKRSSKTGG